MFAREAGLFFAPSFDYLVGPNSRDVPTADKIWSGWDGVGTAAVTLVGPIAYFTRVCQQCIGASQSLFHYTDVSLDRFNNHLVFWMSAGSSNLPIDKKVLLASFRRRAALPHDLRR
jgi:hypothetical protein